MRTSATVQKIALVLLVFLTISNANPTPQRRKHYQTSSSYLDSYQFPGSVQQQRPPPPRNPPNQYGGYNNRFGQNSQNFGQRYPTNNFDQTFGSGSSEDDSEFFGGRDHYGTRFDFEGSGSAISDDEDDFDDFEGSGDSRDSSIWDQGDPYNPTTNPTTPKVVYTT